MYKLSFFCFILCLSINAFAQRPEKKAVALIHKITATWCTPCGTWGWTLAEDIRQAMTEKALYLGLFASSSTANQNAAFYNETAATLAAEFTFSGYPSFGVNGLPYSEPTATGGIDAEQVKANILAVTDSFSKVDPMANAAGRLSIDGNRLKLSAKVRFWEAAEGDFYLAAYIVEDNAMNLQSGRSLTGNEVPHPNVLRASMNAESAWGRRIDSGQIADSAEYDIAFSYTISDPSWDKTNLNVYLVLWKKTQEQYNFINAAVAEMDPLTVKESDPTNAEMKVFPNPANTFVHIPVDPNLPAAIRIRDISGKTVWSQTFSSPENAVVEVNVEQLQEGIYILTRQQAETCIVGKINILR